MKQLSSRLTIACCLFILLEILTSNVIVAQPTTPGGPFSLVYSPDGTKVVASGRRMLRVWNAIDGSPLLDFTEMSTVWIHGVTWSPDSTRIATVSSDQFARIWNISAPGYAPGELLFEFQPFTEGIDVNTSIDWNPGGQTLAIGGISESSSLIILDTSTYEIIDLFSVGWIEQLSWHPNPEQNKILIAGSNGGPIIASIPTTLPGAIAPLGTKNTPSEALAWSPDGSKIAVGYRDGQIYVWDSVTNEQVAVMAGTDQNSIRQLAWSPDGTRLAAANWTVSVWNSNTGELITTLGGNSLAVDFSPQDSKLVYSAAPDELVIIDAPQIVPITITVPPTDGTILASDEETRFQAVAYDPAVGTNDGDGIQGVEFEIRDSADTLLYSAADTTHAYCAFGGDGPCNVAPGPITSASPGTYTLKARAQSTGGTWTDWVVRTFVIGDSPTPVPTDTPVATATNVPVPTATEPPATPPILFTSDRDGNHEIYAMNPDGSSQTRLTNNAAMDIYPAWFPDHSRLVFASTRDGAGLDVYTMLPDGSSVTRLTTSSGDDYGGNVSPDGTRIVFVSTRDGDLEIIVMNADGSGQTQLTSNTAIDSLPSWTADGTRITFTSFRDGNMELYSMNPDGSDQTRLTNSASQEYGPVWSPDGSKMALVSTITGNADIFVANADGTGGTQLTNYSAADGYTVLSGVSHFGLSWSPDGSKIVFISTRDGNLEVYVMNADGSGQTRLTTTTAIESFVDW